ncbi:MAG: hypothetical protein JO197_23500 [Acidobacteria bacterium]|nr:hypothetical protein [Acidobacteriota bacterium]MBV9477825.1 hypothetical protein [Acidobacteriota bacterium]
MRRTAVIFLSVVLLLLAGSALAGTFIVPDDDEMVTKADAIVVGTVEGAYAQEADNTIETVYEIRLERAVKGIAEPNALLRVVTMGGVIGDRGVIVSGEAQYEQGERVLVFLTRDRGRWRTTDLTLGKFKFATSTTGERLLVRDMDDVLGWDRSGAVHQEPVRKEEGFMRFVEARAHGRAAQQDYSVDPSEVMLPAKPAPLAKALQQMSSYGLQQAATTYDPATYTSWVNNTPTRWPNISAGVTWYKRSDQNISGAADGGVSVIQGGLAAWTNECGSNINLMYGGQTATVSKNFDSTNVVEFNDPQGRVSGSWTGAGTVAITFTSFGSNHTFLNRSWLSITDADVVFQDGFPGTSSAFAPAMTHELGHGIGWRHSNQSHLNGGTCDSTVEECTSAAIMNSSVNGNYGFTLQPWDIHAAQGVYPGGTCGGGTTCTPPTITTQPTARTVAAGISTTITVTATGTGLTYEWYVGAPGNTANRIPGVSGPSLTVTPGATTTYWVRVVGQCGTANSTAATVTVTAGTAAASTASKLYLVTPCRTLDTRAGSPLYPASTQLVTITGKCGVPAGAKAIVMNITAVTPASNGTLIAYPGTGEAPPGTSTVSYRTGRTRANNSIMRLSSDGRLAIYNSGPSAIHFLIDVTGYFQ